MSPVDQSVGPSLGSIQTKISQLNNWMIVMKFGRDVHDQQRMNPAESGDPIKISLMPL